MEENTLFASGLCLYIHVDALLTKLSSQAKQIIPAFSCFVKNLFYLYRLRLSLIKRQK